MELGGYLICSLCSELTPKLYFGILKCASQSVTMKMIAEYLEHALTFERMAADEKNPVAKADFEKQAAAYRKLAAERSKELFLNPPSGSELA